MPQLHMETVDIRNALSDIKSEIEYCQELTDKYERSDTFDNHMIWAFALSNLEIKMTNFAVHMREKFRV